MSRAAASFEVLSFDVFSFEVFSFEVFLRLLGWAA